jgi:UDP-glucose 4-epimerase
MAGTEVVLVSGVSHYWGGRLAARLAAEPQLEVMGLDASAPAEEIDGLEFVRADIHSQQLSELLRSTRVSVVCHLKFREDDEGGSSTSDRNVSGAMNVLSACAEAGVERVVLKSSTAVYGAHPDNSAFLTEETPLRGSRSRVWLRDLLDIEAHCEKFRGQNPQTAVSLLRFANIVGPTAVTPMTRFLGRPVPMILLGFDPMMQLVHEDDVVEALAHAVMNDTAGAFNVAAGGAMPLSRLLRLARKVPLPVFHLLAYMGLKGRRARRQARRVPIEWDYLRYPWLGDLSRMREEMGFQPRYEAAEALAYLRRAAADVAENEEE